MIRDITHTSEESLRVVSSTDGAKEALPSARDYRSKNNMAANVLPPVSDKQDLFAKAGQTCLLHPNALWESLITSVFFFFLYKYVQFTCSLDPLFDGLQSLSSRSFRLSAAFLGTSAPPMNQRCTVKPSDEIKVLFLRKREIKKLLARILGKKYSRN